MQRLIGYVMEKFGELGPVRRLFKFFFGRIFSNLIDREIKLSDFKNHILELENLPLSVQKINKIYLAESPYCLHSGVIGKLKIKLASFKELTTKDIEVAIDRIHLVFKFNPQYCKPKGTQLSQSLSTEPDVQDIDLQDDDDDDEDLEEEKQAKKNQQPNQQKKGKKDMFKQFIRQVLSNIKFSMNGITIDLFMNEPATEKEKTISQVFLRLHLQKLKVYQQKKESVLKKLRVAKDEGDNLYWIKLRELSAFILNEKENSNKIPAIDHPACIFACSFKMKQVKQAVEDANKEGNKNLNSSYFFDWTASVAERDMTGQNQDDEAFLPNHFQIELLFNPNDGRVKGLKVYLPPVEFQVDPIQFRVLRNYLEQFQAYDQMRRLSEFNKSGFKELDLFPLKMRQQESEFQEEEKQSDSSIAIQLAVNQNAFLQDHFCLKEIGKNENDRQNQELPNSSDPSQNQKSDNPVIPSNKVVDDEFSFSNMVSSEIEFDFYESQLDFKIIAVNAYFLKQRISQNAQKRGWIYYYSENPEPKLQQQQYQPSQRICTSLNDQIPTNYFMFSLKLLQLQTESKLLKAISIQSVKILDVSLVESKGLCHLKPEARRHSGLQIPSLFGAPPSNSQLFTSSQKFNFGKTNSPKRPRQNMYASIRSSPPLAPISAQPPSNCDLYSSSMFQSCMDNNEMGLNSKKPDIPEEKNLNAQANNSDNQEDDDLFMSIDNSQFFHSTVSQLRQVSQVLEKIEEEDKSSEIEKKKRKDGVKTKDNINKKDSKLQQAQVGGGFGNTSKLNQEKILDEQAVAADWRLDPERQHYCVSYVLLIKPVKMDQQRRTSNSKGNTLNEVGGAFKEKILAQSSWNRDSSSNNNKTSNNKNNPISDLLQHGFSAQLVKRGSEINIEGVISQVFIAGHYNLLKDITKILLNEQSSEWREYSSNSLAIDKKLSTPDSIVKLQEFNAQQEKILLFEQKEEENKENTNNTNSNYMKNVSIQISVKGIKCGWLPYRDLLKEIDLQPRKCFCDVLRYPRESKSYGIVVEIKDMQVQSGFLNHSQTNSNIAGNNNSNSSNTSVSVNIAQVTAGLVKLSRTAALDSSKELFTVFPLMEIMQIKLSLSQLANTRLLNLQTETISLCAWKLNTILDISKAISSQYETLLLWNNTNPFASTNNANNSCEEKLQRQEPSTEMLEFQQQQEVLSVEFNVKELQLRFAYSQKWKTDKKNGSIPRKSQQKQEQIQDKHTLGSWIGACPKLQSKFKLQSYYAVTQLSVSENYTLELLLLNSFIRVNSSQRVQPYIEKTCKLECAIFEIYLIDNQQTLVHLSDYQYPTMSDRQQIYSQKTSIGFSREVNDYKLLVYSASSFLPQNAKNYWSTYSSEQDINQSNTTNNNSRVNQHPAGSQIKSQINQEGNNLNLNEDPNAKPFLHLRLSIKSTCPSQSRQNNQFSQKNSSNVMPSSTTMVKISALNIGNVNVRFGDFSSRPAENILYHISHFQTAEKKQTSDENEAGQRAQPSALKELPQASAVAGPSSKEAQQTSQISIFLKNGCFHDIMIDLFPLHDSNIRKSFPKVFEGISSSNVSKSYWTNQRSVLNIKKVEISLFQYDSSSSQISANAQILGIELLTLVFNDYNMFINPLLLRTYQLPLLQQNPPAQTQLIMLNDYIYTLGFTPIFEIDALVGFDATSLKLQIKRCQLGACKDSFTALPLHFAILSLLLKRLLDVNSNSSHSYQINEKFGESQQSSDSIKDSKISSKDNKSQGSGLKAQNNQGPLLKSSNSQLQKSNNKDRNEKQFFEQMKDKKEKDFDEDEFEEIDEEFMLSMNRSEEAGEKAKKKFIQDAKEKDIMYFHKQGMENAGETKQKIDFSIENLEIQLFSGRNFDFEELSSLATGNSSSIRTTSSLSSNIRNQNTQDSRISIPAVGNNQYLRHRRTEKSYNQSLLLSLNGLQLLYSQSSQKQKLNLVIQAISIVGTAEGKSSTILQKKDNSNNNTQPMVLTDILIDDEKNQVFIKANIDRLKLVVDKAYKNLFEDLSSIKLDPKCSSNEMNEDQSLYISEIREIDEEDSHRDEERKRQLFLSDDNEGEDNEKEEDDEYEICESESIRNQNNNQSSSSQYKLCLLQINGLQCEITVNWVLSSILKDSLLQWDELYLENEKGREINAALSEKIIHHYTQLFSKNQQLIKLLTDLVLIRNISNLAKGVADLFILPYSSLVSRDTKLTDGILQGVKGLQNTLLMETHNLFSVARSIYNTCIRQNLNPIKRIKKLFKPNKK